jgi:4-alpha-glucanotransferase
MPDLHNHVSEALSQLGIKRLVLAIHDQSFPSLEEEEIGRGSPYSAGARKFLHFISSLGFNAVQFGPQGKTTANNPSPYDATLFSKNELSIGLYALAHDERWHRLLEPAALEALSARRPHGDRWRTRIQYTYAWNAHKVALELAYDNFVKRRQELAPLWSEYETWVAANAHWLERDALFELLAADYGSDDWRQWSPTDRDLLRDKGGVAGGAEGEKRRQQLHQKHARLFGYYRFCQFVVHRQHDELRDTASREGLKLFADLQIGFSPRDVWALRDLFLDGYLLGAPPSRTNPAGQPWGYSVLDPQQYHATGADGNGPVMRWLRERINKLLREFDGMRVDHPHGLICPWVYKSDHPDALHAVQNGARLFGSPNLPDHPELAKFAIVRPEQLADEKEVPRYADNWIRELSDEQVEQYAILIRAIRASLLAHGRDESDIICEVLSSCPFPLRAVLAKYGLGRFRVTQKAQPSQHDDVYRSENAEPEDWIMVGTHDTPPLWKAVDGWEPSLRRAWADYLSQRLQPDQESRPAFAARLVSSTKDMCEAMFADLFVGPAQNVYVFFADLLGLTDTYNEPGVVSDRNWVISVPNDFENFYRERTVKSQALNLPKVLAMALRAKRPHDPAARNLASQLDDCAAYFSCEKSSVEK